MRLREWLANKIIGGDIKELRTQLRILKARGINYVEAITEPGNQTYGVGPDWSQTVYGEYYIKSVPIYAAISKRANALIRAPLRVYQRTQDADGKLAKEALPDHPLQTLLDKVNPFWTGLDLQRATETYLGIWGACYWILIKPGPGSPPTEIWPARPDKIRIIPDKKKYIAGFRFDDGANHVVLLPEEVVWMRYFNPLSELGALAPVAVGRLSADMGIEALRSNRNLFKNGMLFGNVGIELENTASDPEIEDFYKRLKKRFASPENAYRPIVMSPGMKAKNLGFAPKEMEFMSNLRWSLEDIARVWDVPKILLQDLENATYSNIDSAERMFWRNTIIPEMQFLQSEIQEMLVSQFKDDKLFIEYDLSQIEILKEEFNQLATRQREDVKVGLITINEARAERGLKSVPWGDVPPVPAPAIGMGFKELQAAGAGPDGYKLYNPPALTDQAIERAGLIHIRRLDRFERRFKTEQVELFEKQKTSVLKKINQGQKSITKQAGQTLFNPEEWLEDFIARGKPLYAGAIQEAADDQIAQYGFGISFDLKHPLVQEWLTDRIKFWADRVNEETGRLLMQEITEANNLGESIREIQGRVEKVFRFSDTIRSERIARTEMQSAINRGSIESYRQSGVVEQKMWISTNDERTRETHAEAHRQTVPLEANFFVGGEYVFQPGEGSAESVINCRCTSVPIIKESARNLKPAMKKIIKRDENGFPIEIFEIPIKGGKNGNTI